MTDADRTLLAQNIRSILACGKVLSDDYAAAVGDTPEIITGNIVIRNEEGRIVARIPESVLVPAS